MFAIVSSDSVHRPGPRGRILVHFFSTDEVGVAAVGHQGCAGAPVLDGGENVPGLGLEVVVLHRQILPVHPHDDEDLGPPGGLGLVHPEKDLVLGVLADVPFRLLESDAQVLDFFYLSRGEKEFDLARGYRS